MQETEHLTSAVDQLAEMKPDVLLVEKSVARDAQNALLERGISLALNVKRANLDRLAQCTGAQVRQTEAIFKLDYSRTDCWEYLLLLKPVPNIDADATFMPCRQYESYD